jgi:hypothetical protein
MGFMEYASYLIPINMAWQVQQHFGRIITHHDSVEK